MLGSTISDFFERPILNSPYKYPICHLELDKDGQPTQRIVEDRCPAEFISPIPLLKKCKSAAGQGQMVLNEGKGSSEERQQRDATVKITLKVEINAEAWATINRVLSRPFDKPKSGRIAVKVINQLGDEVMRVFEA